MNLTRLSKQNRKQLVMAVLIGAVMVALLIFCVIQFQYSKLKTVAAKQKSSTDSLQHIQAELKRADAMETEMPDLRKNLDTIESDIASGDPYAWLIQTVRQFRAVHKVDISSISPIGATVEMNLFPRFPYRQASLSISGKAYYHDFGQFVADFENQFPHIRLLNLDLTQDPSAPALEAEKLNFRMDLVTLVKKP